jgi:hypothetical protein
MVMSLPGALEHIRVPQPPPAAHAPDTGITARPSPGTVFFANWETVIH